MRFMKSLQTWEKQDITICKIVIMFKKRTLSNKNPVPGVQTDRDANRDGHCPGGIVTPFSVSSLHSACPKS